MSTAETKKQMPLTPAQKGIWLGQALFAESARYNAAEYLVLSGSLNSEKFASSVIKVLQQAQGLHVAFSDEGDLQELLSCQCHLERLDFSLKNNGHECALSWMSEDLKKTNHLNQGRLYRTALIKTDDQKWIYYLNIHHIACDGYSFALLFNSIMNAYENLGGMDSFFGNYNEAVTEQLGYEITSSCAESEKYWANVLTHLQAPVSLSMQQADIADVSLKTQSVISLSQRKALDVIANKLNVTWSDLLIASVASLVFSENATSQISLGLPVMVRMGTPAVKAPMMCMNISPLVINLTYGSTYTDLIKVVAKQIIQDRPHHRFRYETLKAKARKSGGENSALWGPVVNVMPFARRNKLDGCDIFYHTLATGPVEDISIAFSVEANQSLKLNIEANPNRYAQATIERIQNKIISLIDRLPKLLSQQLTWNIKEWSWIQGDKFKVLQQPLNSSSDENSFNLWGRLSKTFHQHADKVALRTEEKVYTYDEMKVYVDLFSGQFTKLGLAPDKLCALALSRSPNAVFSCLACIKLGCPFLFIDLQAPPKRNMALLNDCNPAFVIAAEAETIPEYLHSMPLVKVSEGYHFKVNQNEFNPRTSPSLTDAAYIIYTSGSTGKPKGVEIGERALYEFVESAIDAYGFQSSDQVLQFAPLHFDACIEEIFCTLCSGATLVLRNDVMLSSIDDFCRVCEMWNISILDLPTAYWHELTYAIAYQNISLPECIKTVIIGGEAAEKERVHQWVEFVGRGVRLFNTYGPTEATVVATIEPLHLAEVEQSIPIGKPLQGRAVAVINEKKHLILRGNEGELVLLGSGLANSYLNLPAITQQSFIHLTLPWLSQPQRCYRTGDRVSIDENGKLQYLGRIDDEIKISGQRISPAEIESALLILPHIKQAAITSLQTANGTRLIAHIAGDGLGVHYTNCSDLRSALLNQLPETMLPAQMHVYQSLPLNGSGKINRKQLTNDVTLEVCQEADHGFGPLSDIWRDILGVSQIQPEDDFFALGGQSLQVIQLANRLSKNVGRKISADTLFKNPRLQDMYSAIVGNTVSRGFSEQKRMVEEDCNRITRELEKVSPQENNTFVSSREFTDRRRTVLLTGVTGFVGTHLLYSLLKKSNTDVICLARGECTKNILEKIKSNFSLYGLAISDRQIERVTIALHDLHQSDDEAFKALEGITVNADIILHSAAVTSVTRDYLSLRQMNTFATGKLLKCAKRFAIPMRLISTIAVAPSPQSGGLIEGFVPFHEALSDGYQQSKWAAEELTKSALGEGVDARIYRLGRVCGSVSGGYINPNDLIWQIILTGLRYRLLPDINIKEPWSPADEIAEFIVSDCFVESDAPVLNTVPEKWVNLTEIFRWLKKDGFEFQVVPLSEWCQAIKTKEDLTAQSLLAFFEQKQKSLMQGFEVSTISVSSEKYQSQLRLNNQSSSTINYGVFKRFVDFAVTHLGLIRASEKADKLYEGGVV